MPYLQRSGGEKRKKKSQEKKSISIKNASYTKCTINKTYFWASEQAFEEKTSFEGSAIRYCKTSSSQSTKNLSIYFPSENQQQYLALDLLYIP
ncbi:hypothetical protein RIR_jg31130.t1 [Rhizophagus irregularis DAOM 181602=DAOM 197198]|nr:hypothetical protein RIR_jg31130.t1 [Rhizophagus irregularis DAOM 181602=DAOM 197198]